MPTLSYTTAGESHGPGLLAWIDGLPQGLELDLDFIDNELLRRQGGYGRGGRQRIETDRAEIITGFRRGHATGSPLVVRVANRDDRLDDLKKTPPVHRPRPGHADLAGSVKWLTTDCRETLERASARETAVRVAAGAVARCFLRAFGIEVFGFVRGGMDAMSDVVPNETNWRDLQALRDASDVYVPDEAVGERVSEHVQGGVQVRLRRGRGERDDLDTEVITLGERGDDRISPTPRSSISTLTQHGRVFRQRSATWSKNA